MKHEKMLHLPLDKKSLLTGPCYDSFHLLAEVNKGKLAYDLGVRFCSAGLLNPLRWFMVVSLQSRFASSRFDTTRSGFAANFRNPKVDSIHSLS